MEKHFIIKIQGKQYEKGRGRLVVALACFIVALVILMIYSSKYFIALCAPIFFLLLRLKTMSAEKTYLTDAACAVTVLDRGFKMDIQSTQSKLCGSYMIAYNQVNSFTVENRKVTIDFYEGQQKAFRRTLEFYVSQDDVDFWTEQANKAGA